VWATSATDSLQERATCPYLCIVGTTDIEVAIAAAEAGAEVVRRAYGNDHVRHLKGPNDFATVTDADAEHAIRGVLSRYRPGDSQVGEEFGASGSMDARRRWLIDPLCGTLNFAATTPLFSVNVALIDGAKVTAAVVADPIAAELFWTAGDGAFRRHRGEDHLLTPIAISMLVEVNCDGPADRAFVGGQLVADPRLRMSYGPRVVSSTLAVAWVASGRRAVYVSDGYFRDNLHFAAGIALCEAAGCAISDLAGDPIHTGRGIILAADHDTHSAILRIVQPHLRSVR
jgi:myo-inositol-1(or 4)-monophosphatase